MHPETEELTTDELAGLSDEARALIDEIRHLTDPGGDGGRQVTSAERRRLLRAAAALVAQLTIDIID